MDTSHIDIREYDKARLLAALYNRARPLGMGHLHWEPRDMTVEEAIQEQESDTSWADLKWEMEYLAARKGVRK